MAESSCGTLIFDGTPQQVTEVSSVYSGSFDYFLAIASDYENKALALTSGDDTNTTDLYAYSLDAGATWAAATLPYEISGPLSGTRARYTSDTFFIAGPFSEGSTNRTESFFRLNNLASPIGVSLYAVTGETQPTSINNYSMATSPSGKVVCICNRSDVLQSDVFYSADIGTTWEYLGFITPRSAIGTICEWDGDRFVLGVVEIESGTNYISFYTVTGGAIEFIATQVTTGTGMQMGTSGYGVVYVVILESSVRRVYKLSGDIIEPATGADNQGVFQIASTKGFVMFRQLSGDVLYTEHDDTICGPLDPNFTPQAAIARVTGGTLLVPRNQQFQIFSAAYDFTDIQYPPDLTPELPPVLVQGSDFWDVATASKFTSFFKLGTPPVPIIPTAGYIGTLPSHPFSSGQVVYPGPNLWIGFTDPNTGQYTKSIDGVNFAAFTGLSGVPYPSLDTYDVLAYTATLNDKLYWNDSDFGSDISTIYSFNGTTVVNEGTVSPRVNGFMASNGTIIANTDDGFQEKWLTISGSGILNHVTINPLLTNSGYLYIGAFGNEFFAISYDSYFEDPTSVIRSTDGINWTYETSFWPTPTSGGVFAGPSALYLAYSNYDDSSVALINGSGVATASLPVEFTDGSFLGVIYNEYDEVFVIVNTGTNAITTTKDFETYSEVITSPEPVNNGGGYGYPGGFILYGSSAALNFSLS